MVNTDYVVREWSTVGGDLITVSVVDMGGRLRYVTMKRATETVGGADELVRATIATRPHTRPHS
jgi:hypothetical protein